MGDADSSEPSAKKRKTSNLQTEMELYDSYQAQQEISKNTNNSNDLDEKSKESTPPLILDKEVNKTKPINSKKPSLIPSPSSGTIEIRKRAKKPGLAKVPSNLLAFNGLVPDLERMTSTENEKSENIKKRKSDKEENDDDDDNKEEE